MRRNKKVDLFERLVRAHTFLRAEGMTEFDRRRAITDIDVVITELKRDLKP